MQASKREIDGKKERGALKKEVLAGWFDNNNNDNNRRQIFIVYSYEYARLF